MESLKNLLIGGMLAVAVILPEIAVAEGEGAMIEELVVTARRRAESVQDVPGTVTAIGQSTIEGAGVERVEDFIRLTPGVTLVNTAEVGDTQVNIRGINGARDAETRPHDTPWLDRADPVDLRLSAVRGDHLSRSGNSEVAVASQVAVLEHHHLKVAAVRANELAPPVVEGEPVLGSAARGLEGA